MGRKMSFITDQINKIQSNVMSNFNDKFNEILNNKLNGSPFGCPTAEQEKIISLITSSEAFQNSMAIVTDTVKSAIVPVNNYLNELKKNLPSGWTEADINNLINQLNVFDGVMDKFRKWTDRLSGVVNVEGLPGADTLFSLMDSYQSVFSCAGIDVPTSQNEAKQMMSSLLIDKVQTDYSSSYISSIPSLIQNGASPSSIVQALNDNKAIYTDAMITDENAYTQALTSLTNKATGLNISTMNPGSSAYQMVIDKCGSENLKNLLK